MQAYVCCHVRETAACVYNVESEKVLFQVEISFVRTVFAGTCIGCVPIHRQLAELVFSTQAEVHSLLKFQACVPVVGCPPFGFYLGGLLHFTFVVQSGLVQVFVGHPVTVFPVMAAVVDTLQCQPVIRIYLVIESQ